MIASLPVRVAELLFAVVVLGLSATMIKGFGPGPGHVPSLFDYGAFCGAAGTLIALVGIAACFMEPLQGMITLVLDCFASFFLLAGGIAYAATIKVGSCNSDSYLSAHEKTFAQSDIKILLQGAEAAGADFKNRCRMTQASTAFLWFTFACAAGTVFLSHLSRKSGGGGSIV